MMAHQREPRTAKINKKQKQRLQAQEEELSLETEQEAKAQETALRLIKRLRFIGNGQVCAYKHSEA